MSIPATLGPAGAALIKGFESCGRAIGQGKFAAYPDPGTGAAPWTIGWGSTGPDIKPGLVWGQAQCDARFERDTQQCAAAVAELLRGGAATSQNQFDALVSFAYNAGRKALAGSTLLKLHRAGNYARAAAQFEVWDHAGGRVMTGLLRRRKAEAALYATPDGAPAPKQS